MILTKKNRPSKHNKHRKMEGRPFSHIIGTCMTAIAVSCEEGLATATDKGLCNFVKANWGCFCAIISA